MKIGITCYPVYGGSGVVATELGIALAERGHEIHFVAYAPPFRLGGLSENIYFHEVPISSYPLFEYPPYTLTLTSQLTDLVRYQQVDILHMHYAIPHATSALLARQILQQEGITVPVATTLHGTDITIVGRDPSFAPVVRYSMNQSDGLTAVSEYLRRETLDNFSLDRDIAVIPNSIDTRRFRRIENPTLREEICPKCEKVLVHISNFRPVKNATQVIRVFHRLREEGLSLKLLMVGDGPDRMPAEHMCRTLGIHEHVRFMGKQDCVEEILSIGDVFILPSASETFGLAALEAMACGLPVVASDIGGLPELVTHGETGFLCPLNNVESFTARVRQLFDDEALLTRMSQAARHRAVEHFDVNKIVPMYEEFYNETIAKQSFVSGG